MLGISKAPVSETKFIICEDLKTGAGKITFLAGIMDEAEPRVVDEFEGFEGVGGCKMLWEIVAIPNPS